jgi:hypothetical protein
MIHAPSALFPHHVTFYHFIKGKPNLLIMVIRTCYCVRYRWLAGVGVAVPVDAYTSL